MLLDLLAIVFESAQISCSRVQVVIVIIFVFLLVMGGAVEIAQIGSVIISDC